MTTQAEDLQLFGNKNRNARNLGMLHLSTLLTNGDKVTTTDCLNATLCKMFIFNLVRSKKQ
jgi:hypothetical protein